MNTERFAQHTLIFTLMSFIVLSGFITTKTEEVNLETMNKRVTPFSTIWKEPVVIEVKKEVIVEKEVIVYVEKEEEPYYEQNINYQYLSGNFDIMQPSNMSSDDLVNALGESRSGLIPYADAIIEAEQVYGLNALYLAATLGYESGWGRYESGINNIAGWKDEYGGWKNFNSEYECIMTVANGLVNDFVVTQGSLLTNIVDRYCPDDGYLNMLLTLMYELQSNL